MHVLEGLYNAFVFSSLLSRALFCTKLKKLTIIWVAVMKSA